MTDLVSLIGYRRSGKRGSRSVVLRVQTSWEGEIEKVAKNNNACQPVQPNELPTRGIKGVSISEGIRIFRVGNESCSRCRCHLRAQARRQGFIGRTPEALGEDARTMQPSRHKRVCRHCREMASRTSVAT